MGIKIIHLNFPKILIIFIYKFIHNKMRSLNESLLDLTPDEIEDSKKSDYIQFLEDLDKAYSEGGADACKAIYTGPVNEGLLGGVMGFLVGPSAGKIVARALGVEKGILYDLLTSRLVSAAIGHAIQKELKS